MSEGKRGGYSGSGDGSTMGPPAKHPPAAPLHRTDCDECSRLKDAIAGYEAKVGDFALETLRASNLQARLDRAEVVIEEARKTWDQLDSEYRGVTFAELRLAIDAYDDPETNEALVSQVAKARRYPTVEQGPESFSDNLSR